MEGMMAGVLAQLMCVHPAPCLHMHVVSAAAGAERDGPGEQEAAVPATDRAGRRWRSSRSRAGHQGEHMRAYLRPSQGGCGTHTSSLCCVPPALVEGCASCCYHLACNRRSSLCDLHLQDMTWGDREKVLRMLFASLQRQRQELIQAPAQRVSYESDDDEVDNAGPLRGIMNLAGPAQLV